MKWIFFALFCILPTKCNSQEVNQEGMNEVTQVLTEHIQKLQELKDDVESNLWSLKQIKGYLNAIGLGNSAVSNDSCNGWFQFTPFSCIRKLEGLETYEDAWIACRNEFQSGRDINYPTLLKITTKEKNDAIVKILEDMRSITAIWIDGKTTNYTNFGETSKSAGMDCVELRNVEVRGKWFYVESERKNSVICEKKIVLNYPQIIEKSIENSEDIQNQAIQIQETKEQTKSMQEEWANKFHILKNKCNSESTVTTTTQPSVTQVSVNRISNSKLEGFTIATLPLNLSWAESVYDGDDSIYIFGGWDGKAVRNEIYRLNLSSNTVDKVGILPDTLWKGSAVKVGDNIFYFGGQNQGPESYPQWTDKVFKFDTINHTVQEVAKMGTKFGDGGAFLLDNSEDILLIDSGFKGNRNILKFNTRTLSAGKITTQQEKVSYSSAFVHGHNLLIFSNRKGSMEILNLKSYSSTAEVTNLPSFSSGPGAVVSDGTFGYFIGRYTNSTTTPTNALIRFDPNSFEHEFIPINNFPFGDNTYIFHEASAVYVEKLKRIYIIGGFTFTERGQRVRHNQIWYIQLILPHLDSQIPAISAAAVNSCSNKSNGFHPYISNSTVEDKFIGCTNGTAEFFTCPSPLSFDTAASSCNYPMTKINHLLTCKNKTDELHPHPENCEMFLGCKDGFLDIFKCPNTLQFDSISLKCTYPEMATCATTAM